MIPNLGIVIRVVFRHYFSFVVQAVLAIKKISLKDKYFFIFIGIISKFLDEIRLKKYLPLILY